MSLARVDVDYAIGLVCIPAGGYPGKLAIHDSVNNAMTGVTVSSARLVSSTGQFG